MSRIALLDKLLAALHQYRTLLKEDGLSQAEITHRLASLTPHYHPFQHPAEAIQLPNSNQSSPKSDFQNQTPIINQTQSSLTKLINSFLRSYGTISQALTQLLAEVQYQIVILTQNSEDNSSPDILLKEVIPECIEKAHSSNHEWKSRQERKKKDRKKKNMGKHNTSKGRAIEQLQNEAQSDNNQPLNLGLDPNLAQIKALQQYLELKLIQGSLGINSLSHLQRESDGYDVGRMDSFKPIVVLNL